MNLLKIFIYLIVLTATLIVLGGTWYYTKNNYLNINNVVPKLPATIEDNALRDEPEIAFLSDGMIWVLNSEQGEPYKLVNTTSTITNFKILPSEKEIYWTIDSGELWKMRANGNIQPLVTILDDMSEVEDIKGDMNDRFSGGGEKFTYLRGEINDFYLSPSGNYIVYEAVERYTGCCGGFNQFPTYSLWSMTSEGMKKAKIVDPKGSFADFRGWLPDDAGILYSISAPDEPTTGRGFHAVALDGSGVNDYKIFCCEHVWRFPWTTPKYSPDGKKIAYFYEGAVFLADATNWDGPDKKKLADYDFTGGEAYGLDIVWSDSSQQLFVKVGQTLMTFSEDGEKMFNMELDINPEIRPWSEMVLSKNNQYAAIKVLDKNKASVYLFSLATREARELDLQNLDNIPPTENYTPEPSPVFISKSGKLYYIYSWTKKRLTDEPKPPSSLWSIDINGGQKTKIADNVLSVVGFK